MYWLLLDINECVTNNPCKSHGSECADTEGDYLCSCKKGWHTDPNDKDNCLGKWIAHWPYKNDNCLGKWISHQPKWQW